MRALWSDRQNYSILNVSGAFLNYIPGHSLCAISTGSAPKHQRQRHMNHKLAGRNLSLIETLRSPDLGGRKYHTRAVPEVQGDEI